MSSLTIDGRQYSSLHFVGILGSGMSAIAQYLRWSGLEIAGSDRLAGGVGGAAGDLMGVQKVFVVNLSGSGLGSASS